MTAKEHAQAIINAVDKGRIPQKEWDKAFKEGYIPSPIIKEIYRIREENNA